MSELPQALFLMGPTASGKTALALWLADRFSFEIISVDSALVYRGMNIGTSKPDSAILEKYPHHLVNICEPPIAYSAAQFRLDALEAMQQITQKGKIPLLVGGTMLYFRALIEGLSNLPAADPDVRKSLEQFAEKFGLAALHERLAKIDPEAASRIHPNDPQRIQRALEVYEISRITLSDWWKREKTEKLPYTILKLAVTTSERKILHQRIEARFIEMLEQGFVEEVNGLKQRGDLSADMPSMRSVGYRQIWQHLDAEFDFATMREKGIIATRQLAKRQLTWLRSEQNLNWINTNEKNYEAEALKIVSQIPRLTND